jgi:hypothetical protein
MASYYSYLGWFKSATLEKRLEKARINWPNWVVRYTWLRYTRQPLAGTWALRVMGPLSALFIIIIDLLVILRIKGVIY